MTNERVELLDDLARAYRIFGAFGWGDTGDGHISARDPVREDSFWLLGYGVPFTEARSEDLILLGPEGEVLEGEAKPNKAGFFIHQPLLAARRDVVSVAHTHTPWGVPFSAEARLFDPITQESCIFFEDCALFNDEEVQVQDLEAGARIAQTIGRNNSLILRNHGLLTVGATIAAAVGRFVIMERVAEAHLKVRDPKPISAEAARYARSDLFREDQQETVFQFLAKHHGVN